MLPALFYFPRWHLLLLAALNNSARFFITILCGAWIYIHLANITGTLRSAIFRMVSHGSLAGA